MARWEDRPDFNFNPIGRASGLLRGATALVAALGCFLTPCESRAGSDNPEIVAGDVAPLDAWKFHAGLLVNGKYWCGGSLVSHRWVLTAAHCVSGIATSTMTVVVGTNDRPAIRGQTLRILGNPVIHAGYDHTKCNRTNGDCSNDIALLHLAAPALPRSPSNYSKEVASVGLVTTAAKSRVAGTNFFATAIGFGKTAASTPVSTRLRQVEVPISNCTHRRDAVCVLKTAQPYPGICQGDSGGALLVRRDPRDEASSYLQVGISSMSPCDSSGFDEFTSVPFHAQWIAQQIGLLYFLRHTFPVSPYIEETTLFHSPLHNVATSVMDGLLFKNSQFRFRVDGRQLSADPVRGDLLFVTEAETFGPANTVVSGAAMLEVKQNGGKRAIFESADAALMSPMRTSSGIAREDYVWLWSLNPSSTTPATLGKIAAASFVASAPALTSKESEQRLTDAVYDPVSDRIIYVTPKAYNYPTYSGGKLVAFDLKTNSAKPLVETSDAAAFPDFRGIAVDAAGNIFLGKRLSSSSVRMLMLPAVNGLMPDGSKIVDLGPLNDTASVATPTGEWTYDNLSNRLLYREGSSIKAFDPITKKKTTLFTNVVAGTVSHPVATTKQ